MLIPSKHSGYRAGRRLYPGGKGGNSAPPPDPALIQAQIKSMGIQDDAIQKILQNSDELAPLQKEQMRFGLESSKTAYDQSQEDRKWSLGRRAQLTDAQDAFSDKVNQFDTEAKRSELASQATGDVNQAFSSAREQSARSLARQGVNPNSGRALATENQLSVAQAAGVAGAATGARRQATDMAFQLQGQKANMLSGYPTMASGNTNSGAAFAANGVNIANSALAGLNSGTTTAAGVAGQMGANATGMYTAQGNYKTGQDNANRGDSLSSTLGGIGGIATGAAKLAPMFGLSDRRLKENIVAVGTHEGTGLKLYEFNYKSAPSVRFRGVMADEVEQHDPEAVIHSADGYAAVDYGRLGIELVEV